jgi:hypothetical protein
MSVMKQIWHCLNSAQLNNYEISCKRYCCLHELCNYISLKQKVCSILLLVLIIKHEKLLYDQKAETNSIMKRVHAAFILDSYQ